MPIKYVVRNLGCDYWIVCPAVSAPGDVYFGQVLGPFWTERAARRAMHTFFPKD